MFFERRRRMKTFFSSVIIAGALGFLLSGCSSVMSPYSASFSCPNYNKGKCVPISEAYKESVQNPNGPIAQTQQQLMQMSINTGNGANVANGTTSVYDQQVLDKMTKLIQQPKTPIVVPPSSMRVLILPYVNENNELEMGRYVYFFTGEPKWIFQGIEENY